MRDFEFAISDIQINGVQTEGWSGWEVIVRGTRASTTDAIAHDIVEKVRFDTFKRAVQFAYDLAPAEGFPARTEPKHVETPSNV